jgi:hypothetical protein
MTRATSASWSVEMRDRFDALFNDRANFTYPQIMRKMNSEFPAHQLTRSAVCGHAFRNGYTKGRSARSRPLKKPSWGWMRRRRKARRL